MAGEGQRPVFIVSDGTGRTCEQVVRSALVQFGDFPLEMHVRPGVRSAAAARRVVDEAAAIRGIIFFTFVAPGTRRALIDAAQERFVESVDVLGPVLSGLNTVLNRPPRGTPGLYYRSEREHFDRIDAIDYTLKHDDGQRLRELGQADVVLVGVSRASKSSTCFYLAYRGVFAANVPLLPGRPPPPDLVRLDPRRVVGLSVNRQRLQAVRLARAHAMGVDDVEDYVDAETIAEEVRHAHDQMARHGWTRIDVSYLAIEEIAREVMHHLDEVGLRRRRRRRGRSRSTKRS